MSTSQNTQDQYDEKALLLGVKAGDKAAFGRLVRGYMDMAYRLAFGLCFDAALAQDLSQEAFIRFWRARGKLDASRAFMPLYYTILRRLFLNAYRDEARRKTAMSGAAETLSERQSDPLSNPAKALEAQESRETLWAALRALSAQDRELIVMKDISGYSYAQIAVMKAWTTGSVGRKLFEAREALGKVLERVK